ncbi:MAG: hypothetical protein HY000_00155 [Planctomycetes bacterium]|nr:hypothetical protein [Planctomycetota bacterium]
MDPTVDIAVMCALELEASPLVNRLKGRRKTIGNQFVLVEGNLGSQRVAVAWTKATPNRVAAAADALLCTHRPRWLVAAGFAVGLVEDAWAGDIVLASELMDEETNYVSVDIRLSPEESASSHAHTGRLVSTRKWPHSRAEKQDLHSRTGALAADLQSFTLAKLCAQQQTKFLTMRILADDCSRDAGAAVGAVLSGSGRAMKIWKLRNTANVYADRLAGFLVQVLPGLT